MAAQLGYRPNIVSIGLRNGSTRTLGFISGTVATSQFAGDMIRGAIDAAKAHGFLLYIGDTAGDDSAEQHLLDAMLDRQVDGIILAPMFTRMHRTPVTESVPTVLLNTLSSEPTSVPAIIPDEVEAGRAAARLLIEAGHRDIHLIGCGSQITDITAGTVAGAERLAGIHAELAAAGLTPASGQVADDWLPPHGYSATRGPLRDHPRPGALIYFNDRLAFGAYQDLQEAGLTIATDVSVI